MAENFTRWHLRPAWRLAMATFTGLVLTVIALAWPSLVRGSSPPVITAVDVKSSKSTYFYSPPLANSGGTVYFNNLGGANQVITVTVAVSSNNASNFAGGDAFGIAPSTSISNADGTWSVAYTVHTGDVSQNGVVFTITDSIGLTDTITINFARDIVAPEVDFIDVTNPQWDSNADETDNIGNWYRTSLLSAGWSFTATITENGAGHNGGTVVWDHVNNNSYDQTLSTSDGRGTFTQVATNPDSLVIVTMSITDRVGNKGTAAMMLGLDTTPPNVTSMAFSALADTDSGSDGINPNTVPYPYYDDPTIDLQWSVPNDGPGSGAGFYTLYTAFPVYTTTTYAYDQTSGTLSGVLNVVEDGWNSIIISVTDHVGNVSPSTKNTFFEVDTSIPEHGKVDVSEDLGGQYLYIDPWEGITGGTLYYNNDLIDTSFTVEADRDNAVVWGNSDPWFVEFDASWGESATRDTTRYYMHTYTINTHEIDDAFAIKFVNNAGNVDAITITAVLDTEGPQVVYTNVTDPDYDPDGDELDGGETNDNWYRTSGLTTGWTFTTTVTDAEAGVADSNAYWNHSVVTNSQSIPAPGGDGTFLNVNDDSDGAVQVTIVATDHVNNSGSATLEIQLDGKPPSLNASPWTETNDFMTLQGGTLYFNLAMPITQSATVSGSTADGTGSGLDYAEFEQKPNLRSIPVTHTTTGAWSSNYNFSSTAGEGPGSVQVAVYDHVGNLRTHTYDYIGVLNQPNVAFDSVTQVGYDAPLNNPLDDIGNWYAEADLNAPPGTGWWFHAAITPANSIGIVSTKATWEHEGGPSYYQAIVPTLNTNSVQGTFVGVRNNPSGLVTVTLTITDALNRVASDTLLIRLDKDGPAISDDGWKENSKYLHVNGTTLYFSNLMTTSQVVTLSGHAEDAPNGAGVNGSAAFTPEPLLGYSSPNPNLPDWSIEYLISASSLDTASPLVVTVEDNLGNKTESPYTYVRDITPPTTPDNFTIETPPIHPGYYNTRLLDLSWDAATDSQSQLRGYYLGTSYPPVGFYPPPTTTTTYNVNADGTFTFHLVAKDNVSNPSLTSTGPITIDTRAPVPHIKTTPEDYQNRILVEWGANDPSPGTWPTTYDVQYRVGTTGTWQSWTGYTNTPSTSAYFGPDTPILVQPETPYYFRVRARDYVNNESNWSGPVSGGVGLKRVYLPILQKSIDSSIPYATFDGFETGTFNDWKAGGQLSRSIVTHPILPGSSTPPPLSGDDVNNFAARLGSPDYGTGCTVAVPLGGAYIKAYAYVPADGTPYLRFNYRVRSYDTVRDATGEWWDRLEVQVNGTPLARYGNPDYENLDQCQLYDTNWQQAEFDLSSYAGQIVILTFLNELHVETDPLHLPPSPDTTNWFNTYSYVDNIRIEVE